MKVIGWILKIAVFALLVAFALGNTQPATVGLFGRADTTMTAPVVVFLLIAFALGLALGLLIHFMRMLPLRRELARAQRELQRVDDERRNAVARLNTLAPPETRNLQLVAR